MSTSERIAHKKTHMVADIGGCLSACANKDKMVLALLEQPDFKTCVKKLESMRADGYAVVPSDTCDNQDYEGHCAGHVVYKRSEQL